MVDSAPIETVKFARSQSGWRSIPEAASAQEHQVLASPRPSERPASKAAARARHWLRAKRDLIETVVGMLAD